MTQRASHLIPVVIAEFEDLIARGLELLINNDPHLDLVGNDIPHQSLPQAFAQSSPRVAILNFSSLHSPIQINELSTAHPNTHLVILAHNPSPTESNQLLAFGASACLAKDTQARDILNAIHLASRGLRLLPKAGVGDAYLPIGPERLTRREADVLELLQSGKSNAQIALTLQIGTETVRTHARHIYRKLGVSTRQQLREP